MSVTIGIIGERGNFGKKLKQFCMENGFNVIGSDLNTPLSNKEVVEKSDVVIFSVPPRFARVVIEESVPFSREEQLWLDVTSVKVLPVEAMRKSKAEVVGLHPMSAPSVDSFKGQTIIKCVERLDKWKDWLDEFLLLTKAKIVELHPHTHDIYTSVIQSLEYCMLIAMMGTLGTMQTEQFDRKLLLKQATPLFMVQLILMARILGKNPELYADIEFCNEYTLFALRNFESRITVLRHYIERGDREAFVEAFTHVKTYFKERELRTLSDIFEEMVKVIASERSKDSI